MGGLISTTKSNDNLAFELMIAGYIKSNSLRKILKAVDRGAYIKAASSVHDSNVYDKEKVWTAGNFQLSSPIVYATILENLELEHGMSFLNVGSGTGYLSTMCGLMIGKSGTNHGIEVHASIVNHARTKLEEFLKTAPKNGEFDFCPPEFFLGNCMESAPAPQRYDRINVGAACPNQFVVGHFINMLKIGGICILPFEGFLVKIRRTRASYDRKNLLSISIDFNNLILPVGNVRDIKLHLPPIPKDMALQALAEIPGVTISYSEEWLETAKLVQPGEQIYDDICKYIGNGQEHGYGLKVLNIIHIVRKKDPYIGQHPNLNTKLKMLLWHGTPVQSVPSILQHGLRFPQTSRQMFGPGIYFADRASKAANYSGMNKGRPQIGETGYMFLCEVLLGEIYNAKTPQDYSSSFRRFTSKMPEMSGSFDSLKCSGEYIPDGRQQKTVGQNLVIPYRETIRNREFPFYAVRYNEFAVYRGDQCKPCYLVKFQFTPTYEQYYRTVWKPEYFTETCMRSFEPGDTYIDKLVSCMEFLLGLVFILIFLLVGPFVFVIMYVENNYTKII